MSRVIAIGDIHGCSHALERLLTEISPISTDVIVGIGDFVDRGPNSARVIEVLIQLVADCNFVPLIGNHELMMFKGMRSKSDFEFWFDNGGSQTLASYGGRVQNIPQHHVAFLSNCRRYFETDNHFFVHANYDPNLPFSHQPDELLFWQHLNAFLPAPHYSGKIAIVGHTPQLNGEVRNLGHVQIIDTFCYGDGWLTAVDVNSGELWQANNYDDFQKGILPKAEAFSPRPYPESFDMVGEYRPRGEQTPEY
jgi:serine/threonine protein phosphatase 1